MRANGIPRDTAEFQAIAGALESGQPATIVCPTVAKTHEACRIAELLAQESGKPNNLKFKAD